MLVTLTLTPDDFLHGSPCNPHGCPTYLALKRITMPGSKVIVQPENCLIYDPINPEMVTVQFPAELVAVIQRHDDHSTVLLEPETFEIDIPKEFLRNGGEKARPAEENEISEKEFAEAIRAAFEENRDPREIASFILDNLAPLSEPRELRYGPNKKAA